LLALVIEELPAAGIEERQIAGEQQLTLQFADGAVCDSEKPHMVAVAARIPLQRWKLPRRMLVSTER
jgi:hypothetical protein